ncbi:MAG: serine protease [Alkalibacterium sp.]|nr:serine protease [Alkalibacterium sp.]
MEDTVAVISNPYEERNSITAGKVISRKTKPFNDEDGEMQHPVIKHTALISEGSSGSALLNKDLEIVGIN